MRARRCQLIVHLLFSTTCGQCILAPPCWKPREQERSLFWLDTMKPILKSFLMRSYVTLLMSLTSRLINVYQPIFVSVLGSSPTLNPAQISEPFSSFFCKPIPLPFISQCSRPFLLSPWSQDSCTCSVLPGTIMFNPSLPLKPEPLAFTLSPHYCPPPWSTACWPQLTPCDPCGLCDLCDRVYHNNILHHFPHRAYLSVVDSLRVLGGQHGT